MHPRTINRALPLAAVVLACQVAAAPVSSSVERAASEPGMPATASELSLRLPLESGDAGLPIKNSRTIDLLLELQGKAARPDLGEPAAPRARAGNPLSPPARAEPLQPRKPEKAEPRRADGLFELGEAPLAESKEARPATHPWQSGIGAGDAQAGSYATPRDPARYKREELVPLPRNLFLWVRENRALVLGCAAGLLALLWGGSIVKSRRRA